MLRITIGIYLAIRIKTNSKRIIAFRLREGIKISGNFGLTVVKSNMRLVILGR